jgi:hypothetical protein
VPKKPTKTKRGGNSTSPLYYWGRYYGWQRECIVLDDIDRILARYMDGERLKFRHLLLYQAKLNKYRYRTRTA